MQNGRVRITRWGRSESGRWPLPRRLAPPFSVKPLPIVKPSGPVAGMYTSPAGHAGAHAPASQRSIEVHPVHASVVGAATTTGGTLDAAAAEALADGAAPAACPGWAHPTDVIAIPTTIGERGGSNQCTRLQGTLAATSHRVSRTEGAARRRRAY